MFNKDNYTFFQSGEFIFIETCRSYPNQFDVIHEDCLNDYMNSSYLMAKTSAYIRLRGGVLRVMIPDVGGDVVLLYEDERNPVSLCDEQKRELFPFIAMILRRYHESV